MAHTGFCRLVKGGQCTRYGVKEGGVLGVWGGWGYGGGYRVEEGGVLITLKGYLRNQCIR